MHVYIYIYFMFELVPIFQFAFALRPNRINMSTVCNFTFVSGLSYWMFVFMASRCLCETESRVCRQRVFLKAGQGNETISIYIYVCFVVLAKPTQI